MKIQNIIKVLWKIKFGSKKFLKPREAPTTTSTREPLEAASQRGGRAGPPLPGVAIAPVAPTARSHCSHHLQLVLCVYKSREPRVEHSSPSHSSFSLPITLSCSITCKNIFPQSSRARKLYRKFLSSSPPSQACGLFDLFSLT